jgi:hypothetical protein
MRILLPIAVLLFACSSSGSDFVPVIYDTCFQVEDCIETATLCEYLAVEFSGLEYSNAICTTECGTTGPLSPDCARAFIGRAGSCYPSSVAGGIDDTPVCLEPCDFDEDCLFGFRCLSADDLCGTDPECPIDPDDAVCVPGPN